MVEPIEDSSPPSPAAGVSLEPRRVRRALAIEESPTTVLQPAGIIRPKMAFRDAAIQGVVILISIAVTAYYARVLLRDRAVNGSWLLQLLLGAGTVAGIVWGAWQRYHLWTLPMRTLSEVVEQVRKGESPIDELSKVGGVPSLLVPVLRDLLADFRRQRQELAELQREMNQRIANRTDALERLLGSLREKASRDPMTGLLNRRTLDETLPRLVTAHLADRKPLTLLMIDVDNFKLLNDTLGHAAGDELLRSIGQIIRSTVRGSDLGFRSGGDEFVVTMDGAEAVAGHALADRLISLVDGLSRTLRVPRKPRLSIGVRQLSDITDQTAQGLLEAADRVLYEVKGARKRAARISAQETAVSTRSDAR